MSNCKDEGIKVKIYREKVLPTKTKPDSIYFIKADGDIEISTYITDIKGVACPLKDNGGGGGSGIKSVFNTDGSISVVGSNNVEVSLSTTLKNLINSALQSGDNISELINDAGYITTLSLPDNKAEYNSQLTDGDFLFVGDIAGNATHTGDASGATVLTLATVNSNVGSFGTASNVPQYTVNAKGLVTASANTPIQITESQVTNLVSDLAGKQDTLTAGTNITIVGNTISASGGGGSAPDATTTVKGIVKLAGDLGGTADLPTTPTALHKTTNESWTGVKSSINTGSTQTNGLFLTNNGTGSGTSLIVSNSNSGSGINVGNSGTGGTGIRVSNTIIGGAGIYVTSSDGDGLVVLNQNVSALGNGILVTNQNTGTGISIQNKSTGSGITCDGAISATGNNFVGSSFGVTTFAVSKTGNITTSGNIIVSGTIKATIPVYANDAAADADSGLLSGTFYKITGSRTIYQKP